VRCCRAHNLVAIELAFNTLKLRKICESEHTATTEFGAQLALSLKKRLADMRAAESVEDLAAFITLHPKPTTKAIFRLDLADGFFLEATSNHEVIPITNRQVDWSRVNRVKLLKIGGNNA